MSIDAIAYVKILPLLHKPAWPLLLIIAENTFNDSGICRVGQAVLCTESRTCERTVRTHLAKLEEECLIAVRAEGNPNGGRANDAIELLGFLDWLRTNRRRKPAEVAGKGNRQDLPIQIGKTKGAKRQLVAGSYKESRTSICTSRARDDAPSEESDFDLEGKGIRNRLRQRFGDAKFKEWFGAVAFWRSGNFAIAEAPSPEIRRHIEREYDAALYDECERVWPGIVRVKYIVRASNDNGASAGRGGVR